jgi:hypothetical protein
MNTYEIVTERIINLLEQGVIAWRRPWSAAGAPRNLVSKKIYRGVNLFLNGCETLTHHKGAADQRSRYPEVRAMKAQKIIPDDVRWEPAVDVFGERALREGRAMVEHKVLSDRRAEGAGVAYLLKFKPPAGKLLKVVATARSDEHIYLLEGGYANRTGEQIATPGAYGINAAGRTHSAFVATETTALVIYRGEPDEVHELDVVDPVTS